MSSLKLLSKVTMKDLIKRQMCNNTDEQQRELGTAVSLGRKQKSVFLSLHLVQVATKHMLLVAHMLLRYFSSPKWVIKMLTLFFDFYSYWFLSASGLVIMIRPVYVTPSVPFRDLTHSSSALIGHLDDSLVFPVHKLWDKQQFQIRTFLLNAASFQFLP